MRHLHVCSLELVIMSAGNKVKNNKKYELVAPDGGWGYMIFVSFIINMSTVTMFNGCFGMLFNDFMMEIGMNSTGVTLLTGISAFCFATSGFFTSSLLKLMSRRKLALLSALLLDAGTIGMIFSKSIVTFTIFQGILPGIAMGITFNLSCSIMNDYFVKKRMFAFSFVQFFVAVLAMLAPLFVRWSLEEYGFRGTLALIAGMTLNNIFAVLLMQPVKWHMKRVEVLVTTEMQPLLIEEKSNGIVIKLTDASAKTDDSIEKVNDFILETEKTSKLRKLIGAFIDIPFFKKFIISCVCIGPAVSNFAEGTFCIILPQSLYISGWDQDMVALAVSLYGFGDLAMRTVMIFASNWMLKFGSQEIYIIGLVLATASKLGMIWSERALPIYIYIVVMGIARCFICVLISVVISDAVPPEKFTQAMGIFMLVSGGMLLIIGPAIGAIRDLTNSYSTAFYLLTSCFAIMILFWSIELVYKKNKVKRNTQKETLLKSNQLNKRK